ncbi:PAS domain-containing sensor histidine kinase [Candidatus Saccharibacteria bacterium]|nr:PAS domain-containing sensor histidine kinase [Candidatus Saccharibacteria bacterium]MCB9817069.1 PAS domain-containing sensor histidine kinase [Candidatus Nomurabacteria bacterium]
MIAHLYPLRESIWRKIMFAAIGTSVMAIGVYYGVSQILKVDTLMSVYIALGTSVIVGIILGRVVANEVIKTTDFLTRAILVALKEDDEVDRPSEHDIGAPSREFLLKLAERAMDVSQALQQQGQMHDQELVYYRTLVNVLSLPLIVVNTDQQITFANEAALKYLELPANEVIGQYFYDACNLSFVSETTLEAWLQSCREGAVVENEVWERVRLNLPENKRKQFDLAAHYRKDDVTGIELALTFFDRTMQYERDDHDLSFVSLAVHELRTPLTIMRGYIEVFEDELSPTLSSEQTAFMHNMAASAQRLSSFVSNILNVARVEENALLLRLKEEPWADVLQQACKDMQLRAQVHDKNLIIDIDPDLPTIAVDKVSIYEVLNNLLDNAIKYTHTKEDIVIKSYLKDDMIETTVTDRGVGIPSSLIGHVFDKFYRAHQSKNSVGGTGLGLYLCKAIVDAHGGTIWVQSKEGQGSTFGFLLPTYASVADQIDDQDNKEIIRGAHGWIKNHSLYRG